MINVLGYIRVSTVNQVKEGYSLGEQEDEIEVDRDGLLDLLNRIKEGDI